MHWGVRRLPGGIVGVLGRLPVVAGLHGRLVLCRWRLERPLGLRCRQLLCRMLRRRRGGRLGRLALWLGRLRRCLRRHGRRSGERRGCCGHLRRCGSRGRRRHLRLVVHRRGRLGRPALDGRRELRHLRRLLGRPGGRLGGRRHALSGRLGPLVVLQPKVLALRLHKGKHAPLLLRSRKPRTAGILLEVGRRERVAHGDLLHMDPGEGAVGLGVFQRPVGALGAQLVLEADGLVKVQVALALPDLGVAHMHVDHVLVAHHALEAHGPLRAAVGARREHHGAVLQLERRHEAALRLHPREHAALA